MKKYLKLMAKRHTIKLLQHLSYPPAPTEIFSLAKVNIQRVILNRWATQGLTISYFSEMCLALRCVGVEDNDAADRHRCFFTLTFIRVLSSRSLRDRYVYPPHHYLPVAERLEDNSWLIKSSLNIN